VGTVEEHLAPGQSPSKSNFIVRFWRGEYSLGISYWAFGAGTYIVVGLTALLTYLAAYKLGADDQQAMRAMLLTSAIPMIWCWVGIWSSADNHVARTGRKGWAFAAKAMVVIGLIGFIGDAGHLLEGAPGSLMGVRRDMDKTEPSKIRATEQLSDVRTSLDDPFIAPGKDQVESFPGQLDRTIERLPAVDRTRVLDAIGFLAFSMGIYLKENEPEKFAKLSAEPGWLRYIVTYEFAQKYGRDMSLRKYIDLADQFEKSKPAILEQYKASVADREHTSHKQMTSAHSGP
jgi:hypothetical protein